MEFMIIAYNPKYIKIEKLDKLVERINFKENIPVYLIEHTDDSTWPIYQVKEAGFQGDEE